jgi:alginate O-acetyltransferase complex protein AlgI
VYIPLGGSRLSPFKTYRNLWVTFLLSGFWHGAAWHFVIWGGLHALYLSVERWTQWPLRLEKLPLGKIVCLVLTLFQVIVAWVFFRAVDFSQGLRILNTMFTDFSWSGGISKFTLFLLLVLILREAFIYVSSQRKLELAFSYWKPVQELTLALLLTIVVYWRGPGNVFIYFQF